MEEVRVENVSFAYKDKLERWILKDINLKTNAGEFVLGVIAAPFVIAWGVLTLPVWFYAVTH